MKATAKPAKLCTKCYEKLSELDVYSARMQHANVEIHENLGSAGVVVILLNQQ